MAKFWKDCIIIACFVKFDATVKVNTLLWYLEIVVLCIYVIIIIIIIMIIIIIYHDFLPPSRRDCHVKSGYAHTMIKHTPLTIHTRHLRLIFSSWAIFTVYMYRYPSLTCTGIPPLTSDNPPERGRPVRKIAVPCKNGLVKRNHLHMHLGSPLLPNM